MTPRQSAALREMGISPLWRLREHAAVDHDDRSAQADKQTNAESALTAVTNAPAAILRDPMPGQSKGGDALRRSAGAPEQHIDTPRADAPAAPASTTDPMADRAIGEMGWDELEARIRQCRSCVLGEKRRQAVPGIGDRGARWMLVGEGPGAEEDLRGEPFVGQAGKLLDNMLAALGLKREEGVFIANAVKCRPPHNRTPETAEIASCLPYLERQIDLVQPALLIALGRPAAQALLGAEISISAARGKRFEHRGVPVVVTYHPAYLLRNPQDKGKAWEDLCFARRLAPPG